MVYLYRIIYSKIIAGISHRATEKHRLHHSVFLFDCVEWLTDRTSLGMACIKEVFRKGILWHKVLFILAELCKSVSSWCPLFLLLPPPKAPGFPEKSSSRRGRVLSDLEGPAPRIAQTGEGSENRRAAGSLVPAAVTSQVSLCQKGPKIKGTGETEKEPYGT